MLPVMFMNENEEETRNINAKKITEQLKNKGQDAYPNCETDPGF